MFEIKVEQVVLFNALKRIKPTVGNGKDGTKIFDKFLYIEGYKTKDDKYVRLVSTNYTDVSDIIIDCIDCTDGICPTIVEFNKLYSIISTMPSDSNITVKAKDHKLEIYYKNKNKPLTLNGISSKDYPIPNECTNDNEISISCKTFKEGIEHIANILHNTQNNLFNCINVNFTNKYLLFSGIDATYRRICMYVANEKASKNLSFFIECNRLKKMLVSYDSNKNIRINIDNNNLTLSQDDLNIQMRLINGTYPDCMPYFPNQYETEIQINKMDILNTLRRTKIIADNKISKGCMLDIKKENLNIKINNETGNLNENIITKTKGKTDYVITFNIEALSSAIQNIETDNIKINIENKKCCTIEPIEQKGYLYKCIVPAYVTK